MKPFRALQALGEVASEQGPQVELEMTPQSRQNGKTELQRGGL